MKKLINLTPHTINVMVDGMETLNIVPSGTLARATEMSEVVGDINGIPLIRKKFGDIQGLPEPSEDTIYIVSMLVKTAVPDRLDVVVPSDPIRDAEGRIVGCKSLAV